MIEFLMNYPTAEKTDMGIEPIVLLNLPPSYPSVPTPS